LWVEREAQAHNRMMSLAWTTAGLSRAKKMPPLSKLLVGQTDAAPQSQSELKAMLHTLSGRYGGAVRTVESNG
jgi:hypothetical protein